jgi:hypothetical protein
MGLLVLGTKGNVSSQQDNLLVELLRTISGSCTLAGVGRRSAAGLLGEGLEFFGIGRWEDLNGGVGILGQAQRDKQ